MVRCVGSLADFDRYCAAHDSQTARTGRVRGLAARDRRWDGRMQQVEHAAEDQQIEQE